MFRTVILTLVLVGLAGCSSLYQLPDPPSPESWRRHSLTPGEDDERSTERFIEAQEAVLTFTEALNDQRFDDAYGLLSNETRILLDSLSSTGRGEHVLESGEITRNGTFSVDVIDLFVIRDLDRIEDEHPDSQESETYRRKEVYVFDTEGVSHHVVLIREADAWRIHKPDIDLTPGAPGRRATDS